MKLQYEVLKCTSSKIPYMRWSNAFMFYAMSYYMNTEKWNTDNTDATDIHR